MKPSSLYFFFRVKCGKQCKYQCCACGRGSYGCLYLDWAAPNTIQNLFPLEFEKKRVAIILGWPGEYRSHFLC